jgi:hypothetical protein
MPGFISDTPLARELIRIGDEAIAREDDVKLRAYYAEDYVFHGPGGDLSFEELRASSVPISPRCAPPSATCESSASRSSRTATFWRHVTRSPATSPASSRIRLLAPSSRPVSTSSGKRSTRSGTTATGDWPRNGYRPTTAAS